MGAVCEPINVGTGIGVSVLELVEKFEKVSGERLHYKIGPKRDGDIPAVYADANKSNKLLNWKAKFDIEKALIDAWNWQKTLD